MPRVLGFRVWGYRGLGLRGQGVLGIERRVGVEWVNQGVPGYRNGNCSYTQPSTGKHVANYVTQRYTANARM